METATEVAWGSGVAHVPSIATRHQGRRRLGPAALRTCPFASPGSQVRARLGPGGYCRRSGNGGPQTCLPTAHGVAVLAGLYGPSSPTRHSRPSRGVKPREADDTRPPRSGLTRLPREEEIKAGQTSRGSRDVSHDDQDQAGASARSVLVSSLVLRRQA